MHHPSLLIATKYFPDPAWPAHPHILYFADYHSWSHCQCCPTRSTPPLPPFIAHTLHRARWHITPCQKQHFPAPALIRPQHYNWLTTNQPCLSPQPCWSLPVSHLVTPGHIIYTIPITQPVIPPTPTALIFQHTTGNDPPLTAAVSGVLLSPIDLPETPPLLDASLLPTVLNPTRHLLQPTLLAIPYGPYPMPTSPCPDHLAQTLPCLCQRSLNLTVSTLPTFGPSPQIQPAPTYQKVFYSSGFWFPPF